MAELLLVNPRRRKRHKKSHRARRRNPRRHKRHASRRYHANPSLRGSVGRLKSAAIPTLKTGFFGAIGGIGNDLLYAKVAQFLPDSMKSGYAATAAKALSALLVGIVGNMVLKGRGAAIANGAMSVVLYNAVKSELMTRFPTTFGAGGSLALGDYFSFAPSVGYGYDPALPNATGIGEFVTGANAAPGMGEYLHSYNYEY